MDVLITVAHFEHAALVSRAAALLANQLYVGQEAHFHRYRPVPLARFASAAGYVEREMPRAEASLLSFGSRSEQVADGIKRFHVRGGIRARSSPDGRLINHLHGQDRGIPFDSIAVFAPVSSRALGFERLIDDVVHQR